MLPEFPKLTKISEADIPDIFEFVKQYPPYNEFNPVNLLAWDALDPPRACYLNGNLVISLVDSLTLVRVFSFLGSNSPLETTTALMEALGQREEQCIDYLPHASISSEIEQIAERYAVSENRAYFDYVYDVHDWKNLSGKRFRDKRRQANRFSASFETHRTFLTKDFNAELQHQILELFEEWEHQAVGEDYLTTDIEEIEVLRALFKLSSRVDLWGVFVTVDGKLAGFTINQVLHDGFYLAHFGKSDRKFNGLASFLEKATAQYMSTLGCKQVNFEEDLGIPGLRKYKMSWKPTGFLKKFRILPLEHVA